MIPREPKKRPLCYNPAPITEVYRVAVFNPSGNGVAEFETAPGLLLDARKAAAQSILDAIPDGYTVQVFTGVHTIGRSFPGKRVIQWGA